MQVALLRLLLISFASSAMAYTPKVPAPADKSSEAYYNWLKAEAPKVRREADFKKRYPIDLKLTPQLLDNIGRKMVNNEAGCAPKDLAYWNLKEDFPSIGLGHAIWYPAGQPKIWDESFPKMIQFFRKEMRKTGRVDMPEWLNRDDIGPAPWNSPQEFRDPKSANAAKVQELRQFIGRPDVVLLQTRYLAKRLENGMRDILADAELRGDRAGAQKIYANFKRLSQTDFGVRSMVDYVNFKGEGLLYGERTDQNKLHWGLKQVLQNMPTNAPNANDAFADSAIKMLRRIPDDATPDRRPIRERWMTGGWTKRVNETYRGGHLDHVECAVFGPKAPTAGAAPVVGVNR